MIYTTREININGSTATIDEDIYLFKQDSNIELKFILNNVRFTFQTVESTNVVESSNASYFRVKLLNPNGKTINFPIQEVTDNFIVLLITEELINEDTEVGDYTIQIRLYDKDKNSKLTLPAITNCIHIQQPIFDEVEESTVDTAAIDTASVMMSDEGELPVVDSTGKYIPTLWNSGDTISKAKINHIEKGILQAHIEALANKIPKVTPPRGQDTSDIINLYNMLPNDSLVYLTEGSMIQNTGLIGLCSIYSYNSDEKDLSENNVKSITCYNTGVYVDITSTGHMVDKGLTNVDLSSLMEVLRDSQRKQGQVLTMLDADKYGWQDVIPQVTPPNGHTKSDIATFYNALPKLGVVFITQPYTFSDSDERIMGLCRVATFTVGGDKNQCKNLACYDNGTYINITPEGNVVSNGFVNSDLEYLLNNPNRKKGQVLTMTSDSEYGWADTTPQPYVHSVTGSKEVELTVDPYQIIKLGDLSSPAVTVTILLPMIEESDMHVYKIHLLLMANSSIEYKLPEGYYDKQLDTLQNGVIYELIYTYMGRNWTCHCIEYSNKISNAPE